MRLNQSAIAWMICLLILIGLPSLAHAEAFEVKPGQRQLFLDDVGIVKIDNLTRTMHQPVKRGAVIRHPDPHQTLQTRTAPLWDPKDKLFKLWMTSALYGTSPDGIHWDVEPTSGGPNMVVIDPHDPDPNRRYKAVRGNVGFVVSPDGKNWTNLDLPAIPSGDEFNFSYNTKERLFIHTVKRGGKYGRAVAVATSTDFQNWTDHGLIFETDDSDQELGIQRIKDRLNNPALKQTEFDVPDHYSIQIYNMGMFFYESVFIGLPSVYHHTGKVPPSWPGFKKLNLSPYIQKCVDQHGDYTGFYTVQLVSSRDMKNWNRHGGRKPFIETSPLGGGAYDLQTIIGPSEPLDRGTELWFYYTGIKQYAFISSGNVPGYDDYVPNAGAICLAVLRKDGFMSLDADESGGSLTTKLFKLPAGKLHVNVTCGKNAQLTAQVVEASGKVLATSAPISGEQLSGELQWENADLTTATGKEVQLRFNLRNGQFYSYWFE